MAELITTKERLYDHNSRTGVKFLVYPAGAEVPVDEYKRLTGKDKPESAAKESTKAELAAELTELGVENVPDPKKTNKDTLQALVDAARKSAAPAAPAE